MKHLFPLSDNSSTNNHKRIEKSTRYGFVVDGKELIDVSCNLSSTIIGYDREDIIDHVANELKKVVVCPTEIKTDTTEVDKLSNRIYSNTQCRSIFTLSGSDAVEMAIRCVKVFHRKNKTGKTKIVGFNNSFHGSNELNLSIANIDPNTGRPFSTPQEGFIHLPNINSYETASEFEFETLMALRKLLEKENVACVVQESCSWGGNLLSVSNNYWKQLKLLCHKHNALLVIDDIAMCGGKTGHLYGFPIVPDIFCVGKAFGGGYFPIAAACISDRVYDAIKHEYLLVGYTHSFHMPGIIAANYYHDNILNKLLDNVPNIINKAKTLCDNIEIQSYNNYGTMFSIQLKQAVNVKDLDAVFQKHGLNLGFTIDLPTQDRFIWCVPIVADDSYFNQVETGLRECLNDLKKINVQKE